MSAGGTAFLDEKNLLVSGTQGRPGQTVRGIPREWLMLAVRGLLGGERGLLIVTRAGRQFAATGIRVQPKVPRPETCGPRMLTHPPPAAPAGRPGGRRRAKPSAAAARIATRGPGRAT